MISTRLFLRSAVAGVLALLSAGTARADFEASGELLGYSNDSPYSFARLQVRNRTGDKVRYEVTFAGGGALGGQVVLGPYEIEPDGERTIDAAIPMISYPSAYVYANGRRIYANLNRPSYSGLTFLHIAEMEKWASEKELDDFSSTIHNPGYPHHRSSPSGSGNRIVAQLEPTRLPTQWLCYAPYTAVIIREAAYDRLSEDARAALMKWVDVGGNLLVYGSEKNEVVQQSVGKIRFQSRNPFAISNVGNPPEWGRVSPPWQANKQWEHATGSAAEDKSFPFGVREVTGATGALGLATVFLILAGPVNFFYFRRKGQIRKLMISLPVMSFSFCLLILGYFIATQGFTRKGGSFALTMLDEARGSAVTLTRHSVFSGLYPLGGFKFDRDAAFIPMRKAEDFRIALGPKLHLQSGIFQPTSNFHYLTTFPHTTREKLMYRKDEQAILNGFESPIEALVFRDGDTWYKAENVAPGAKAKLERIPKETLDLVSGDAAGQLLHLLAAHLRTWNDKERNYLLGQMAGFATAKLPKDLRYAVSFSGSDGEKMQAGLKLDSGVAKHVLLSVAVETEAATVAPPPPTADGESDVI